MTTLTKTGYVLTANGLVHDTFNVFDPAFMDDIYETPEELFVTGLTERRDKINRLRREMERLEKEINALADRYIEYRVGIKE